MNFHDHCHFFVTSCVFTFSTLSCILYRGGDVVPNQEAPEGLSPDTRSPNPVFIMSLLDSLLSLSSHTKSGQANLALQVILLVVSPAGFPILHTIFFSVLKETPDFL